MDNSNFINRTQCPVCAEANGDQIYSISFSDEPIRSFLNKFYEGRVDFEYLSGTNYTLIECSECELIYQKRIPDDRGMAMLYESWISSDFSFQKMRSKDLYFRLRYLQEFTNIIRYLGTHPSQLEVLDFGMGWGDWCQMAAGFGCSVLGSELSETRIRYAQSNGVKTILWDEIPSQQLHYIHTEQVFEHISDPRETLTHLVRGLRSRGLIRLGVPPGGTIKQALQKMDWDVPQGTRYSLNPVIPLEHINCFNQRSLERLAKEVGLKRVRVSPSAFYVLLDWASPLNALKLSLLPFYRNMKRDNTCLFFMKP